MKKFNTTAICIPKKHYMVDITDKLVQIKAMIDEGEYFTINRGRQYGKTTTLYMLERYIQKEYLCISISFEGVGQTFFTSEQDFCRGFVTIVSDALQYSTADESAKDFWQSRSVQTFPELSRMLRDFCENRSVVLMIDEVDKAGNFRLFLDFLGLLRDKYINRSKGKDSTFQSVILAGVYDIRNIKFKMIQSGLYVKAAEEGQFNSPWNIAANFTVDMSFSQAEIATMLTEYEAEHHSGMKIDDVASLIHSYTSGYPYLTSRICKIVDETHGQDWSKASILQAVKELSEENNTLFDDLIKNMQNNQQFSQLLYQILIIGDSISFDAKNSVIAMGVMFGILTTRNKETVISNRLFETVISNYFISMRKLNTITPSYVDFTGLIHNGHFNMRLCMEKFAQYFQEIFRIKAGGHLLEAECRMIFLMHLKSFVNGAGFYHIESQTTDERRMDIVVDYQQEEFIIELKTWHGMQKHEDAYDQLLGYMDARGQKEGYLMTFDFSVKGVGSQKVEESSPHWVVFDKGKMERRIYDVMIRPIVE